MSPAASIVMIASNAASRIAVLRASERQRSTAWPILPPRLVIVASSASSGSRCSLARNSITPRTPVVPVIGKAKAAWRPAWIALAPRGWCWSAWTSAIQAGPPLV